MGEKLPDTFKENLSHYHDFYDLTINEHGWVIAKFVILDKSVAFNFTEAPKDEVEVQGLKYSLVIQEDYLNQNRTFRMVRGNNANECLNKYFEIINYSPPTTK